MNDTVCLKQYIICCIVKLTSWNSNALFVNMIKMCNFINKEIKYVLCKAICNIAISSQNNG
jgi:hypothetical protein